MAVPQLCDRVAIRAREMGARLAARCRDESGQGLVEYGMIAMMIAIALILIVTIIGKQTNLMYSNISNGLNGG